MKLDAADLIRLRRIFSKNIYLEIAEKGWSSQFGQIASSGSLPNFLSSCESLDAIFDKAFSVLIQPENRDELIFKSAIIQKILLGRYSLNTATAVLEMRAGRSRADVAIFNGTSTAYEIKSERDTIARLADQLMDYRRSFASVVVISAPRHLAEVQSIAPLDVGIMELTTRSTIRIIRKPLNLPGRVSPTALFDMLPTLQLSKMLLQLNLDYSKLPNTTKRSAMRDAFCTLPPDAAHDLFVASMRTYRNLGNLAPFLNVTPKSTHSNAISLQPNIHQRTRIYEAMQTPANVALNWS